MVLSVKVSKERMSYIPIDQQLPFSQERNKSTNCPSSSLSLSLSALFFFLSLPFFLPLFLFVTFFLYERKTRTKDADMIWHCKRETTITGLDSGQDNESSLKLLSLFLSNFSPSNNSLPERERERERSERAEEKRCLQSMSQALLTIDQID